jgi:di/tricarboxylate transporter
MLFGAWLTLALVGVILLLLAFTKLAPDLILIGAVTILIVANVITPAQALSGFANEGMITVGILYIVGAGVIESGGIVWLADRLFGRPKSVVNALLRMMIPAAGLSAFMNNTPLVAMLIPAVNDWAKRYRIAASKLMMPLSYAAILGGTCTLIGTSTNLVVNGMLIHAADAQKASGEAVTLPRGLGMFDITWVGVPAALAGIAFIVLVQRWLLPNRMPAISRVSDPREYTIEMVVQVESQLVGKTIEEAGLRHLPGLYLAEINREGTVLPAVGPDERLRGNDHLVFVGIVDSVVDLQKIRGLAPATDQLFKLNSPRSERCLVEAVASSSCPVVGKTIRDGRVRSIYNAVVVAVARHGERISGKIGDIVLNAGDTLLLETHPSFLEQHRNRRHFFLVSKVENSNPPDHRKAATALMILLGMVVVVTVSESFGAVSLIIGEHTINLGEITMFKGSLIAAGLMLVTGCCKLEQARRSIDWETLLAIAASFAIGNALEKTGAADGVTHGIINLMGGGPWLTLAAIYGVTLVVTELITNNAAAALMFPFALATAHNLGVNPVPFIICVMMAASAGFATPIGYQTNLMVYGPGGYRFNDYVRIGVPLDILIWIVTVAIAPYVWPF